MKQSDLILLGLAAFALWLLSQKTNAAANPDMGGTDFGVTPAAQTWD
jgi:hypothetical protein